jgi:pyruvate/2-oxoglutarate dehydrogenase complex dihydrolipoamide dehydrogenase (E3) component
VIKHDATLRTSVPHIFIAGDVTNHHQILHYAAEMGKIAGKNAASDSNQEMDYDRHLLAVSFDQYPSALIGLTETQAIERGMKVVTATKHFNNMDYGNWLLKLVAVEWWERKWLVLVNQVSWCSS